MGYSQGVGEKDNSPFRASLSPQHSQISSAHEVRYCPGSLHQSLPPWYKQREGYGPQTRNRIKGILRKWSSAFLKFFLNVLQREKRREVQQPGYEPSGELSNPTICTFGKTFSLEVLSMHLLEYSQKDELQQAETGTDEIKFIAWSQTPCPIRNPILAKGHCGDWKKISNCSSVQQYYEELPFITMTIVISTYILINTNTTKMTIPPFVVVLGNTYFGIYTFL